MAIIATSQLSKCFGAQRAVDGINLSVPERSVFAFLGGNGAGKSTTIRLLLGLLNASEGHIELFGERVSHHNHRQLLRRIGSLVEMPSLYDNLNAYDNLLLNQRLLGCGRHRIDEVLQLMGLHDAKHKRVSQFSLGMKQRLGLAIALLHDPELLILDEPTNGLDPNGIREIRELIKHLPTTTGTTVFVSSHMLDEVEKMADHVAVMHQGHLKFQGKLSELQAQSTLEIRAFNEHAVLMTLREENVSFEFDEAQQVWRVRQMDTRRTAQLSSRLVSAGAALTHLQLKQSALEDLFFAVTANKGV